MLQEAFAIMDIQDSRPLPKSMVQSTALEEIEAPVIDLESMTALLSRVLGSDHLLPPPSQIPKHLREPLSRLIDNSARAMAIAVAAKKLNPDDTQALVDALDLVSRCWLH
jgi:hypothetical protein